MLYRISDGTVSVKGKTVLSHIHFEIRGNEKAAVTGKNGAGKTTLLRLISGEISLDRDDKRQEPGIFRSRRLSVGLLRQQAASSDLQKTPEDLFDPEAFRDRTCGSSPDADEEYSRRCRVLFTGLGFSLPELKTPLREFSGGQQQKILLISLLLRRPDILLLDEPTNHLDLDAVQWLEEQLRSYPGAVLMVSHDRFFLDQTADTVWELEGGHLTKYPGNYTDYRKEKTRQAELAARAYRRQQEEIQRLNGLILRFRDKPAKAAFARTRKKMLERMERAEKPAQDGPHIFIGPIIPASPSGKWVLEAEHAAIGYDRPLLEISIRIRRGQKVGVLGLNGTGKSTFLRTAAGLLPPLDGQIGLGSRVTVGYFDQHSARIASPKTVAEHFHDRFPSLTEKEVRSVLGSFLFAHKAAQSVVSSLSGGEKARLVLAELLQERPNFLILDEPTNHMDIQAKETLESAFRAYEGTILFVSHDRYFLDRVADSLIIFEEGSARYYPFGYGHYLERSLKTPKGQDIISLIRAEDQALISGLHSVPKAERHRLRDLPEDEIYGEWKLRLASEHMEEAKERFFRLWEALPASWFLPEYDRLLENCRAAADSWTLACLDWYDEYAGLIRESDPSGPEAGQESPRRT